MPAPSPTEAGKFAYKVFWKSGNTEDTDVFGADSEEEARKKAIAFYKIFFFMNVEIVKVEQIK